MIEEILLRDQTTGKNILWANSDKNEREEIQLGDVGKIEPRWKKLREHQKLRTKVRAEIFTPPEICKLQNDLIALDEKNFEKYIDAKFLEITCGEAPYLVSRYNAVTGEPIEFDSRFGLLDRKLKLIDKENLKPIVDYTRRAVQSVYGYEFQGDNLFLARKNIFDTVEEFLTGKIPSKELKAFLFFVANIISCNLWQMDGLKYTIPFANTNPQGTLQGFGEPVKLDEKIFCQIIDWRSRKVETFKNIVGGAR